MIATDEELRAAEEIYRVIAGEEAPPFSTLPSWEATPYLRAVTKVREMIEEEYYEK